MCIFPKRSTQPELMDSETVSFEVFHDCLQTLEKINILTLAYRPTMQWIKSVIGNAREPVTIFDTGCGGGDMMRKIWRWAQPRRLPIRFTGIDLNPWSKKSAELVTPTDWPIAYETTDIFSLAADRRADFIISSLFVHHLGDAEIVRYIQWMDRHAERGWLINDLHRHAIPYYFIKFATRLFSRNHLIRHDAAVSVARAFTAADWRGYLRQAGIPPERTTVEWFFPFRYRVTCRKA